MTANIINSVYLALLSFAILIEGIGICFFRHSVTSLLDGVQNADAESYMGGYQVIGGLFGAGAASLVLGVLSLVLIVSILYMIMFLTENIIGYRIYGRLKREGLSPMLIKKLRKNAIIKSILALLVTTPGAYAVLSAQWFGILAVMIPQMIVLVLSLNMIFMLWGSHEQTEPKIPTGGWEG